MLVVVLAASWASDGLAADGEPHQELAARYLAGERHGPIQRMERPGSSPSYFPGVDTFDLIEVPGHEAAGCTRRRWHVSVPREGTAFQRTVAVSSSIEVTMEQPDCSGADYARINPGLAPAEAIAVLQRLHQLDFLGMRLVLACGEGVKDRQCNRGHSLAEVIAGLRPWLVGRKEQEFYIWLGQPGQLVTEVRFAAGNPSSTQASRRIPAPF